MVLAGVSRSRKVIVESVPPHLLDHVLAGNCDVFRSVVV